MRCSIVAALAFIHTTVGASVRARKARFWSALLDSGEPPRERLFCRAGNGRRCNVPVRRRRRPRPNTRLTFPPAKLLAAASLRRLFRLFSRGGLPGILGMVGLAPS